MEAPGITFQAIGVANVFRERERHKRWLVAVAKDHGVGIGNLAFVLLTDDGLLEYNKRYLGHNYYTDVITFDGQTGNGISGDVLISYDRVCDNAEQLMNPVQAELRRVMVHGLLHLLGHSDKNERARSLMRRSEDKYLDLYSVLRG